MCGPSTSSTANRMMRDWTRFFPLAFIAWYARRNCERFVISGVEYVRPYRGVLIATNRKRARA